MSIEQPAGLISVLLDSSARVDERDDAAMDLGVYDGEAVLAALYVVACDPAVDEMVQDSAEQSIVEIWHRGGMFDEAVAKRMEPAAQHLIWHHFPDRKPSI